VWGSDSAPHSCHSQVLRDKIFEFGVKDGLWPAAARCGRGSQRPFNLGGRLRDGSAPGPSGRGWQLSGAHAKTRTRPVPDGDIGPLPDILICGCGGALSPPFDPGQVPPPSPFSDHDYPMHGGHTCGASRAGRSEVAHWRPQGPTGAARIHLPRLLAAPA